MIKQVELVLLPEEAADKSIQLQKASEQLAIPETEITFLKPLKRSIDARSRKVKIRLKADVYIRELPDPAKNISDLFQFNHDVSKQQPVIIVGAGPAGMFAALRLIELNLKPLIIERGKDVQSRRRDLADISKKHLINPDSNYCFGEGGAGTYSDGKLYTRSTKRGDVNRILNILVSHGADEDILVDAHPHIGTNKLPKIVEAIRQTILHAGGEIHFNTRLKDFIIRQNKVAGVTVEKDHSEKNETELIARSVILATGHSARDVYELLHRRNMAIYSKPFALGVRIEHPQHIIDSIQYHCKVRSSYLPPAAYSLTHRVKDRGVYSFCMCPGGIIAPAATDINEIVVNGWSPSKRNNPYANSGMVVSVNEKDFQPFSKEGALAALRYQQSIEKLAFSKGGSNLKAPAQRLVDFVERKFSGSLPSTSYIPGVKSIQLDEVFPSEITDALREAFKSFGKKMKSYYTNEAVLVGVESRTSSPVRIPRDDESLQHPQVEGLFPCGEGAGYAGGIISAAMDGERCAEQCKKSVS